MKDMKTNPYLGKRAHITGDINLASACMSMGVPLDPHQPASVTLREGKPDYGSFHLLAVTSDGKHSTKDLMTWWSQPERCSIVNFQAIMTFIREHPSDCKSGADWMEYAHGWLRRRNLDLPGMPLRLIDVPGFVERHAESVAAHVLAVVYNREMCFEEYRAAKPDVLMASGQSVLKISTALDEKRSRELMARMKG